MLGLGECAGAAWTWSWSGSIETVSCSGSASSFVYSGRKLSVLCCTAVDNCQLTASAVSVL
jgi:hypothetical protein